MGARTGTYPEELVELDTLETGDALVVRRGNSIKVVDPASIVTSVTEEDVLSKFHIVTSRYTTLTHLTYGTRLTDTILLSPQYRVLGIETTEPIRIRLYITQANRDADLLRGIGKYVSENSGLILEFISSVSLLSTNLNRLVDGFSLTEQVYFTVEPVTLSGCTPDFTIKFVKTGV